ncbi:class I SAM-dependent methyltransferase [Pelagicoccus albus]|uniref:Class I SAM-dependent methyltransferase n=1 Tax=Pelagicoccus albus TaxID=415222 RepID=A0A7X1B8F5_9BACT|nr:class I SAM-dependent methyltransferase [Pelagicoccus albus]MBC2607602.1 class I SAM-dependent methyltransferase [Pelagicoccus albus]
MQDITPFQFNEFKQFGVDYGLSAEAEVYDERHGQFRDVENENRLLLDRLDLDPDSVLIDFGAGTGRLAAAAARGCRMVYAVDVSEAMLAKAKARAEAEGLSNIAFCHAGFLNYRHEGAKAAAVTASFSLHHLPDFWKGIALGRIHQMLAEGGTLFIRDIVLQDGDPLGAISDFVETQRGLGGDPLAEDAQMHFREEFSTYDWVMRGLLERHGFRIQDELFSDGVLAEYYCVKEPL